MTNVTVRPFFVTVSSSKFCARYRPKQNNRESAVFSASVDEIWNILSPLDFKLIQPSLVSPFLFICVPRTDTSRRFIETIGSILRNKGSSSSYGGVSARGNFQERWRMAFKNEIILRGHTPNHLGGITSSNWMRAYLYDRNRKYSFKVVTSENFLVATNETKLCNHSYSRQCLQSRTRRGWILSSYDEWRQTNIPLSNGLLDLAGTPAPQCWRTASTKSGRPFEICATL